MIPNFLFLQRGGGGADWISSISRFILLYLAFSFFFRQPAQKQPLEEGIGEVGSKVEGVEDRQVELFHSNYFSFGDVIESRVYLSEEEGFHEGDEVSFLSFSFPSRPVRFSPPLTLSSPSSLAVFSISFSPSPFGNGKKT